ncbi:uncharacterized protein LOC121355026 [Pyrgilauda ruficollis]|uniref:uncharacterized protein LOC121355026 n=1 Tax=Pyrgilauda ruficollis TaxID=221976 RepID=UPI001B8721E6|nr:uncharacterized protein LOC121355026 [Pyrgilauda ruficollis]
MGSPLPNSATAPGAALGTTFASSRCAASFPSRLSVAGEAGWAQPRPVPELSHQGWFWWMPGSSATSLPPLSCAPGMVLVDARGAGTGAEQCHQPATPQLCPRDGFGGCQGCWHRGRAVPPACHPSAVPQGWFWWMPGVLAQGQSSATSLPPLSCAPGMVLVDARGAGTGAEQCHQPATPQLCPRDGFGGCQGCWHRGRAVPPACHPSAVPQGWFWWMPGVLAQGQSSATSLPPLSCAPGMVLVDARGAGTGAEQCHPSAVPHARGSPSLLPPPGIRFTGLFFFFFPFSHFFLSTSCCPSARGTVPPLCWAPGR